jgi:hypothetical protein
MTGELKKLTIEAYKGPKFRSSDKIKELEFTAMFNPTTFNRKLEIEYADGQGFGTSAASKKFKKIKPQDYDLELLIDGTGASGPKKSVPDEITQFMKVCAEYNGEKHRPNYLLISWAKLVLKAVLTSVEVSYTMFDKDGTPLRAKITASFSGTVDDDLRSKQEKPSSPDLTHVRTVLEGDTLPLMSERIYGDSKYYVQVAEANGLNNFRNLEPGTQIFFPSN